MACTSHTSSFSKPGTPPTFPNERPSATPPSAFDLSAHLVALAPGPDSEDDLPKNAIPVVLDALHQVAKELDTYLPRDGDIVKENTSQFDARGSSFNDVGRDQHYHINITVCPHASSNPRAETPINHDIGPELGGFSALFKRGVKLAISARTFVAANVSAAVARF